MIPLQQQRHAPRFFYGWVVVFGCLCIQAAAVGIIQNTLSAFIVPCSTEFGVTRSVFTLYSSFSTFAGLLMAPVWGEFFKDRRFKNVMLVGCLIIGACMFGYSIAKNVYWFYVIGSIKGIFQGMLIGVPIPKILSNWFVEKRGLAMGLALAGSGLAGSVMTPIVTATIEGTGWRAGFVQLAVVYLIITVPIILFIIRETPEEMGQKALGADSFPKTPAGEGRALSGMTRTQAFKSKTFWYYGGALFLTEVCSMGLQNNLIAYLTDIGYSSMYAARIFSTMMAVLVLGKVVLGRVYDRFGMKTGTVMLFTLMTLSGALLCIASRSPIPMIFAVVFGFANAAPTMQPPYMTGRLLGEREYSRIYGVCQVFDRLGVSLGMPVTAAIRDVTGSYVPAFVAVSVCSLAVLALMLAAIRTSPIEIAKFDALNDAAAPAAAE